jgi:AcrR family transcriptional regulator
MSPRGVATPDVRERLFAAAERVVEKGGPGALTSRSVTAEAGCAKGLLHAHFTGFDEFVAELCLDRFARTAAAARALSGLAGQGTVARNLDAVALALFDSGGPAISGLAVTRPAAALRIRQALEAGARLHRDPGGHHRLSEERTEARPGGGNHRPAHRGTRHRRHRPPPLDDQLAGHT